MAAEISEKGPQHEQVEKGGAGYDNHGDGGLNDKGLNEEARLGTENEHTLSLWQAVKTYKRAALWSVLISTTVVMEGYDVTLLSVCPLSLVLPNESLTFVFQQWFLHRLSCFPEQVWRVPERGVRIPDLGLVAGRPKRHCCCR